MVVSIGAIASAAQGVSYFERDGYYAKDDPRHLDASAWAGRGAEVLGLRGPCRSRRVPGRPGGHGARRLGLPARAAGEGRQRHASSGAGPDLLRAQVRLPRRHAGRRRSRRRRPRRCRAAHARLAGSLDDPDPHQGARERAAGSHGRPEDGGRDVPPRGLAQSRPPAPHPCGDCQHGAGRRRGNAPVRQVAHHVQRDPLSAPEADRHGVPERAGAGVGGARLRHREDPCRRALRDRGRAPRDRRGVLDEACGDRGCDGGARPRRSRGAIRSWPSARR